MANAALDNVGAGVVELGVGRKKVGKVEQLEQPGEACVVIDANVAGTRETNANNSPQDFGSGTAVAGSAQGDLNMGTLAVCMNFAKLFEHWQWSLMHLRRPRPSSGKGA